MVALIFAGSAAEADQYAYDLQIQQTWRYIANSEVMFGYDREGIERIVITPKFWSSHLATDAYVIQTIMRRVRDVIGQDMIDAKLHKTVQRIRQARFARMQSEIIDGVSNIYINHPGLQSVARHNPITIDITNPVTVDIKRHFVPTEISAEDEAQLRKVADEALRRFGHK